MEKEYAKLIDSIRKDLRRNVKPSRYQHSERVADTARNLCDLYDVDPDKGYLAGLSHDLCKDMDDKTLYNLAKKDGLPMDPLEEKRKGLLHGRAAAVTLEEKYDIHDPEILESLRYHTFGHPGMCDLAKIIYIADKIEPGRTYIPAGYMDMHEDDTLDEFIISVLQELMVYLQNQGYEVSDQTERFLYSLVHKEEKASNEE